MTRRRKRVQVKRVATLQFVPHQKPLSYAGLGLPANVRARDPGYDDAVLSAIQHLMAERVHPSGFTQAPKGFEPKRVTSIVVQAAGISRLHITATWLWQRKLYVRTVEVDDNGDTPDLLDAAPSLTGFTPPNGFGCRSAITPLDTSHDDAMDALQYARSKA